MPHQLALNKAKIQLMGMSDSVFFTTLLFSLKHSWSEEIQTAATNGLYLKINPAFFMKQSPDQRVGLLVHECLHPALLHPLRCGTRDHKRYNIAGDHVINLMLLARGFKLPANGYADPQYEGMSTEQVYDLLPESSGEYDCDIDVDTDPSEEMITEIQDIIIRASIQSQMQHDKPGTIPGEIQIFLDSLLKPKLPWNRILQKYIQNLTKNDYSFRKPNRRFFPKYHLPSLFSEGLIDLAIAVDASGSVSDEEFKVFVSETNAILRMMKPEKITLVTFDTVIRVVDEVKNIHELSKVKFTGRGGTEIGPVLNWANTNKPKLLLVFTDGDFYFRGMESKVDTIWLVHNNESFKASKGKVIHYTV